MYPYTMSQTPKLISPIERMIFRQTRQNFIHIFFFFYFFYQCICVLFKVFGLNSEEEKRKKVCLGFSCVLWVIECVQFLSDSRVNNTAFCFIYCLYLIVLTLINIVKTSSVLVEITKVKTTFLVFHSLREKRKIS